MFKFILSISLFLCLTSLVLAEDKTINYIVTASPSLVVRNVPDVVGDKVGNIPKGEIVTVTERGKTIESIGGKQGVWVKVNWHTTTGYVFDAFLEPTRNKSAINSDTQSDIVTVPDLTSDCISNAKEQLNALGLRAKEISIHGPIDKDAGGIECPYRQQPKAGAQVKKGTLVTYRSWWEAG